MKIIIKYRGQVGISVNPCGILEKGGIVHKPKSFGPVPQKHWNSTINPRNKCVKQVMQKYTGALL